MCLLLKNKIYHTFYSVCFCSAEIKVRASCLLGKHSTLSYNPISKSVFLTSTHG